MFCLEPVEANPYRRQCGCHIHYHPHCYTVWIQQYNTSCPLCRKSPVPVVNSETFELEFMLVDPVTPTIIETTPTNAAIETEEPQYRRNPTRTLCMALCGFILLFGFLIIIALRTYNII
jgi:hypothetical protein